MHPLQGVRAHQVGPGVTPRPLGHGPQLGVGHPDFELELHQHPAEPPRPADPVHQLRGRDQPEPQLRVVALTFQAAASTNSPSRWSAPRRRGSHSTAAAWITASYPPAGISPPSRLPGRRTSGTAGPPAGPGRGMSPHVGCDVSRVTACPRQRRAPPPRPGPAGENVGDAPHPVDGGLGVPGGDEDVHRPPPGSVPGRARPGLVLFIRNTSGIISPAAHART